MPSSTYTTLYNTTPGTSDAALYTSSSGNVIKKILALNTSGSAATITLYYVRKGDSEGGDYSTELAAAVSVPAGDTLDVLAAENLESELNELVLLTGDEIRGLQGTGSAITLIMVGQ